MQKYFILITSVLSLFIAGAFIRGSSLNQADPNLTAHIVATPAAEEWTVKKCDDFAVGGKELNKAWAKTEWGMMTKLDSAGKAYESTFKVLYSDKGLYVLFAGEDDKITTKDYKDYEEIYDGDVFEVFIHPVKNEPQYFEYEINQLNKELTLTLVHAAGNNLAWAPWNPEYKMNRVIKKAVSVEGAKPSVGAKIRSWKAEIFFPYSIFGLLPGMPPKSGDKWDANFCRIDYDSGEQVEWSWSKAITTNFHDLDKLGSIVFE